MATIEQYKMSTGYYDEERIMIDGGAKARDAAFDAIFGDAQGEAKVTAQYAALLAEARRLNAEMLNAASIAQTSAIVAAYEANDWPALIALRAARLINDDGRGTYELTAEGYAALRTPRATTADYSDQIDE